MAEPEPRFIDFNGAVVFRFANYDTPFWASSNTHSGRWHYRGDGPTQYWTLDPDGAWAELLRRENLRTEEGAALIQMPIWSAVVHQQRLADYSDFEKADDAGFPVDALVDDDRERCRAEGRRLRGLGYAGVMCPSAALPGSVNLTLFGPRRLSTWGRPPQLASDVPACVVALGRPAAGLVARVRFRGAKHAGLEDFLSRAAGAS